MIVKVMVGGGRRSIRAPAELQVGPGDRDSEMNACVTVPVNEGGGLGCQWWSSCRNLNARGRRLEPMSGTACDVQPKSIDNCKQ